MSKTASKQQSISGPTPGPWTVRIWATQDDPEKLRKLGIEPVPALTNDGERTIWAGEIPVASVRCQADFKRGQGYRTDCDIRDANARLIAAAPALQAACDDALGFVVAYIKATESLSTLPQGLPAPYVMETQLRDALALARGRA